jgi:hypothetical protein
MTLLKISFIQWKGAWLVLTAVRTNMLLDSPAHEMSRASLLANIAL